MHELAMPYGEGEELYLRIHAIVVRGELTPDDEWLAEAIMGKIKAHFAQEPMMSLMLTDEEMRLMNRTRRFTPAGERYYTVGEQIIRQEMRPMHLSAEFLEELQYGDSRLPIRERLRG